MSKKEIKRIACGWILTIPYILGFIFYLCLNWASITRLSPSEVGDMLAGASAPLAFLWLVIGYFQQGEELSQNTDAIKAQAEEIKQLVAIETEQTSNFMLERQPTFYISEPRFNVGKDALQFNLTIGGQNSEPEIVFPGIKMEFLVSHGNYEKLPTGEVMRRYRVQPGLWLVDSGVVTMELRYRDIFKRMCAQSFEIIALTNDSVRIAFCRIEVYATEEGDN